MRIIGLGYKKQSGKDTVAKMLQDILPGTTHILHFADELKKEVTTALRITLEELEQNKSTFRPVLQWWGTEYRRIYGEDNLYWIKKVDAQLKILEALGIKNVIIPDVRFLNEAEFVRSKGGMLVNVFRSSSTSDSHASEVELDSQPYEFWDEHIHNTGTLEYLRSQVFIVLNGKGQLLT